MARQRGARVPGRLVASAKSWLSHAGVDRTAPVLPWGMAPPWAEVWVLVTLVYRREVLGVPGVTRTAGA